MSFANAIAKAASENPMGQGAVPVTPGRKLLVDGDGLCYYCAGNDEASPGDARANLIRKVEDAARRVGAESILILLTGSGSHKGHRYAIARVKPYQGQRSNSRRPKNWQYLRDLLTGDSPFPVQTTYTAEADDLFGYYAYREPGNVVILTQDKDMRMLPGTHLDWVSGRVCQVSWHIAANPAPYEIAAEDSIFNDKQYGPKWFWLQMLQGDTADNIPGLPRYIENGKAKLCGEVTAGKLLADCCSNTDYASTVAALYRSYYDKDWLINMIEQAALLWMRRNPEDWDDCLNPGGPLAVFNDGKDEFARAYLTIQDRVREAEQINAATQNN